MMVTPSNVSAGAGPSAESLSLSASLFTSQISSWIPANFGQSSKSTTKTTQQSSLDSVLQTEHDRGERLGLGHPLLDVPKHQRRQEASSSLSTLGKRMGLDVKGKGKVKEDEEGVKESKDESGDEEESRGRIGKKRKVDKVDMFAGKKKAKSKSISDPKIVPSHSSAPLPSTDSQLTLPTEEKIDTPHVSPRTSQSTSIETPDRAPTTASAPEGLNKNQRKKLRKKQKKLGLVET